MLLGSLFLGLGGLGFLAVRGTIRKNRYQSAVNKIDDPNEPEYYAQQFYNAFFEVEPFGWGTDVELIRETLQAIPHQAFFDQVKTAYLNLTKRTRHLLDDLRDELTVEEWNEIRQIIQLLPQNQREANQLQPGQYSTRHLEAWAIRIRSAANYETSFLWPFGTDEAAIYAVLRELPSLEAFCRLNQHYFQKYSKTVIQEILDELGGDDLARALTILKQKSDAKGKTYSQIAAQCQRQ